MLPINGTWGGSCSRSTKGGHWSIGSWRASSIALRMPGINFLPTPRTLLKSRSQAGHAPGNFNDQVVAKEGARRPVVRFGRLLAPRIKGADHGERAAVEAAQSTKFVPLFFGSFFRTHIIPHELEFFFRPVRSAAFGQTPGQNLPEDEEVFDVLVGIADLFRRERPVAPFGQRFPFGDLNTEFPGNQRGMTDRINWPHEASSNLQIEDSSRRFARPHTAKMHILPARVHDDQVLGIGDDIPKGVQRPDAERIDEEQVLVRCHLDEAQLWVIVLLADKFCIET